MESVYVGSILAHYIGDAKIDDDQFRYLRLHEDAQHVVHSFAFSNVLEYKEFGEPRGQGR